MAEEIQREKPYDFTPLPAASINGRAAGHHTVRGTHNDPLLSGVISGAIISESLVHIASGFVVPIEDVLRYEDIDRRSLQTDRLVAAHMRTQGVRVIPGSSIKGLLRSAVEAMTSPGTKFYFDPVHRKVRGVSVTEVKSRTRQQTLSESTTPPEISLANRVFGLTSGKQGYQGHCSFYDARQISGTGVLFRRLPLYRPQPDYSEGDPQIITRWSLYFKNAERDLPQGRKFYRSGASSEVDRPYTAVEACSIGSKYKLDIHFSNLTAAELGFLLIAMGADNDIPRLKIGSGKPVSMGAIRFEELAIKVIGSESYTSFDAIMHPYPIADCVKAANESSEVFKPGREKLSEIMTHPAGYTAGGKERLY